jgi:hypothetical protein
MTYRHLKTGSSVTRLLAGTIPMPMRVLRVDTRLIYCTPREMTLKAAVRRELIWTFDRVTGAEIDDGLGWGPAYGITGSFLVPNNDPRAFREAEDYWRGGQSIVFAPEPDCF